MSWDPGEQLIVQWLYSCVYGEVNIFKWIGQRQINGAAMVPSVRSALPCGNSVGSSSYYKHSHLTALLAAEDVLKFFPLVKKILPRPSPDLVEFCDDSSGHLVMLSVTVPWDPGVGIELSIEELRSGFAEQQSEHTLENFVSEDVNDIKSRMANANVNVALSTKFFSLWLMVTWCCDYSCSRVRLCISLPWDPGVSNQLITKGILSELTQQEHEEILITASSCDFSAGQMCTWAGYCDCLRKCHRAQHQYTVYDSHGNHLPTQFAANGSSNIELMFRSIAMKRSCYLHTVIFTYGKWILS